MEDPIIRTDIDLLINVDESGEVWETRGAQIHVNDQFIKAIRPYLTGPQDDLINLVSKMLTVLFLNGYVDDYEKDFILGKVTADQLLDLKKAKKEDKNEEG